MVIILIMDTIIMDIIHMDITIHTGHIAGVTIQEHGTLIQYTTMCLLNLLNLK